MSAAVVFMSRCGFFFFKKMTDPPVVIFLENGQQMLDRGHHCWRSILHIYCCN